MACESADIHVPTCGMMISQNRRRSKSGHIDFKPVLCGSGPGLAGKRKRIGAGFTRRRKAGPRRSSRLWVKPFASIIHARDSYIFTLLPPLLLRQRRSNGVIKNKRRALAFELNALELV